MLRTYATQFPLAYWPETGILERLQEDGWEDTSWGNDMNPSWVRGGKTLFIAPLLPSDREDSAQPRFMLFDDATDECLAEGEDFLTVLRAAF